MIKTFKKVAPVFIFWGALWGIAEAVLGYILHLVPVFPGMAGMIMFPIGFYFMSRSWKYTGNLWAILGTASIAASIKLLDLFLPGLSPIYTINPAVAILFESVAVMGLYKLLSLEPQQNKTFSFQNIIAACAGWRLVFIAYNILLFTFSLSTEFVDKGLGHITRFFILESVINSIIIFAVMRREKWQSFSLKMIRPFNALATLCLAIFVKLMAISL